jgi:ABC-type cobalamin/Fe3+-siderophores transport system ATPase subunit
MQSMSLDLSLSWDDRNESEKLDKSEQRHMEYFPGGAEWRKWDLHLHVPGTKLNNQYTALQDGSPDVDRFCDLLHESDVHVFGLTDYFCFDTIWKVATRYKQLYPQSHKLLLPNIELRLNEAVNSNREQVDFHLLFSEAVTEDQLRTFMTVLPTELRDSRNRRIPCSEISAEQFMQATVTRDSIQHAINTTFGDDIPHSPYVLKLVPANGNGIRTLKGNQRLGHLTDTIDAFSHAIFGNPDNTNYFADLNRYANPRIPCTAKPVFACSDSHSFDQLRATLGKSFHDGSNTRYVTWVKADPTFAGLLQTLVEPLERVRIQDTQPDSKTPYHVITEIQFSGTNDFPSTISLNSNLVTIIGPRSSGKSSLLAYIAHAVDPEEPDKQRKNAGIVESGPAAGKKWSDVGHIDCRVIWGGQKDVTGRVIYLPQNRLHELSKDHVGVTDRIKSSLIRSYNDHDLDQRSFYGSVETVTSELSKHLNLWFQMNRTLISLNDELVNTGDKSAIAQLVTELQEKVEQLQQESTLTPEESVRDESALSGISSREYELQICSDDLTSIDPYITMETGGSISVSHVGSVIQPTPSTNHLPIPLQTLINIAITQYQQSLDSEIHQIVAEFYQSLAERKDGLLSEITTIKDEDVLAISKGALNKSLDDAVRTLQQQQSILSFIELTEQKIHTIGIDMLDTGNKICKLIAERSTLFSEYVSLCAGNSWNIGELNIYVEQGISSESLEPYSRSFDQRFTSKYFDRNTETIDISSILADPMEFLQDIISSKIPFKRDVNREALGVQILLLAPEIRYVAEIDSDRIGGFSASSMTPGKQALFALTLILGETTEPWPLLIDQPEDDLDSRSIYDQIVKYLIKAKKFRQIIMVTHNANLAIGADSEQVIVANRHGHDRANRDGRLFDYFSGSLEYSLPITRSDYILETCGIREHACQILDGGEEAFQKRRSKYQI